jgi:DNA-binding NarL/FixJ family response regulator
MDGGPAVTSVQDRPHTTPVPLTPAEHRVAVLVCAGHTNPSVAQELFLSVNTISSHLRSIYAKLQVHSRVTLLLALQAAAGADEPEAVDGRRGGVGRLSSGVHGLARRA